MTTTVAACTVSDLPTLAETVELYESAGFWQFGEAIPERTFVRFGG